MAPFRGFERKRQSRAPPGRPQSTPRAPEGGPGDPQGTPRAPEGGPRDPQGTPRAPEGSPRDPQGSPKGALGGTRGAKWCSGGGETLTFQKNERFACTRAPLGPPGVAKGPPWGPQSAIKLVPGPPWAPPGGKISKSRSDFAPSLSRARPILQFHGVKSTFPQEKSEKKQKTNIEKHLPLCSETRFLKVNFFTFRSRF